MDKKNHEVNAVIGSFAPSLYEEKERLAANLLGNILGGPASNSILGSILRERRLLNVTLERTIILTVLHLL